MIIRPKGGPETGRILSILLELLCAVASVIENASTPLDPSSNDERNGMDVHININLRKFLLGWTRVELSIVV